MESNPSMSAFRLLGIALALLGAVSCAVTSKAIRKEAGQPLPFPLLAQNPMAYAGRTVILGGYLIDVLNENNVTRLLVLQSPLGGGEEPGDRDASEGRFMVVYPGFLDPAVFEKNRRVTVAGTVTGSTTETVDGLAYAYPTLTLREIHMWEDEVYPRPYPPAYYDPFYYGPRWPYRPYRYPYTYR
jgi:outer membrane lipoprotein